MKRWDGHDHNPVANRLRPLIPYPKRSSRFSVEMPLCETADDGPVLPRRFKWERGYPAKSNWYRFGGPRVAGLRGRQVGETSSGRIDNTRHRAASHVSSSRLPFAAAHPRPPSTVPRNPVHAYFAPKRSLTLAWIIVGRSPSALEVLKKIKTKNGKHTWNIFSVRVANIRENLEKSGDPKEPGKSGNFAIGRVIFPFVEPCMNAAAQAPYVAVLRFHFHTLWWGHFRNSL